MRQEITDFQIKLYKISDDCTRFCFLTRSKEFQLDAITELENIKTEAVELKKHVIADQDEDSSNAMLSFENMISALINELKMWVALKDDNSSEAWDYLINAQGAARTAMQAHEVAKHLENYCARLHYIEKIVFPPQTFFSMGMVIQESVCSICGKEYGECDHLVVKAYMGEMCVRNITKFDLKEISMVLDPADKHARIVNISDGNIMRDFFTWRKVPAPDANKAPNS